MTSIATTITPIAQTPPEQVGADVQLTKGAFDQEVWSKGRDVYLDKAIRCPCTVKSNNHAQSSCKNCGGAQWLFINRVKTKMVIQSQTLKTNFAEWSEEKRGNISITALSEDRIGFMDRITLFSSKEIHTETVHFFLHNGKLVGRLDYPPVEVDEIFLFVDTETLLTRLSYPADYTIDGDIITLNDSYLPLSNGLDQVGSTDGVTPTISIRYKHFPTFHIIDITRSAIKTKNLATNQQENLPVHAIGRRAHYILDNQNIDGDFLLNNSYPVSNCAKNTTTVITTNQVCPEPTPADICQIARNKISPNELSQCIIPSIDFTVSENIGALTIEQIALIKTLP